MEAARKKPAVSMFTMPLLAWVMAAVHRGGEHWNGTKKSGKHMLRIAHASDTHGNRQIIAGVAEVECDIIMLTGDILNNAGRINGTNIEAQRERRYQMRWGRKAAKLWTPAFRGREVIIVPGNHDFIRIGPWLRHYGHPADKLHEITAANPCVVINGVKFAGFREVPWMIGEWMGEEHDMAPPVERAMACDPDILVTHAPPAGILDKCFVGEGYGVIPLTTWLSYRLHGVVAHFFGHAHESGGKTVEEMGIRFFNGACHLMVHEVEV